MTSESPILDPGAVDALLFDLGGVVIEIDFNRVLARWALHARCDVATLKTLFALDHAYECHERGEIDAPGYFGSLRRALRIDIPDPAFLDGWNEIFVGEVPGMAALLSRARAARPLYLFSNSNAVHQAVWSERYAGVLASFRRVFVSSELGLRKPERAAFAKVAAAIGVPAGRIAFFDDSLENVNGARASGLMAVHVRSIADVERSLSAILAG